MTPEDLQRVRDLLSEARRLGSRLAIRGRGNHDALLGQPRGTRLSLAGQGGLIAYEPWELYVRVAAETPLSVLEAALAEERQELPFEPPRRGGSATVGGMVAVGLAGPRRATVGPLRNFLLGASVIDGRGQSLRFGGTVIKNVAGYDVSRLLAGSYGTLGLLTEVTLRVRFKPLFCETICLSLPAPKAIALLNRIRQVPWPIDASAWLGDSEGGHLWLRWAGTPAAISSGQTALAASFSFESVAPEEADTFWSSLRDQRHPFFKASEDSGPLWRRVVPHNEAPTVLGPTLIEWHGGLRWSWLRPTLGGLDESASPTEVGARFGFSQGSEPCWPLPTRDPGLKRVAHRVKALWDPDGLFESPVGWEDP